MIDIEYKFKEDRPQNINYHDYDPDTKSVALRHYHKLLWEKSLCEYNGLKIIEPEKDSKIYLIVKSDNGYEDIWSSDTIFNSYAKETGYLRKQWKNESLEEFNNRIEKLEELLKKFYPARDCIASFVVWPGRQQSINKIRNITHKRGQSINQTRGILSKIGDRFDLTLECIKRYYNNPTEETPLTETFERYDNFFRLFGTFEKYCKLFLLQDFIDENQNVKNILLQPDMSLNVNGLSTYDFKSTKVTPRSMDEYDIYLKNVYAIIDARKARIAEYAEKHLSTTGGDNE